MSRADYPLVTDADIELMHELLRSPHPCTSELRSALARLFGDQASFDHCIASMGVWTTGDYFGSAANFIMLLLCELGEFDGYLIGEEE